MWATLHYTTHPSWEASRTTNTKQNSFIYRYTHACTCTRLNIYTHLQTHTYTRTRIYTYTWIYIHLTHGARAPPFCHPLSLSNHSKSRWQSGGNPIEWDTYIDQCGTLRQSLLYNTFQQCAMLCRFYPCLLVLPQWHGKIILNHTPWEAVILPLCILWSGKGVPYWPKLTIYQLNKYLQYRDDAEGIY